MYTSLENPVGARSCLKNHSGTRKSLSLGGGSQQLGSQSRVTLQSVSQGQRSGD